VQLWTTLTTVTGDLLALAAAVTNLAAALAQRHSRTRHNRKRRLQPAAARRPDNPSAT
jgi:hypothetical protein